MYKKMSLDPQLKNLCYIAKTLLFLLLLSAFRGNVENHLTFYPITKTPERIALLLPFQGSYKTISNAIRDGFLIANKTVSTPFIIDIINTNEQSTIRASYDLATQRGAHLVVGPLLKEDVQSLARSFALTLPVLTLNYLNIEEEAPANFYQFGLSPLQEATRITEHAKIKSHQSALILVPDNIWGEILAKSFTHHWKLLGGKVAGTLRYSNTIPTLNYQIRRFLEFTPPNKRRTDFDVIFMGATPSMGRQIKPLLDFYFSSKIPIYATASIYDKNTPAHLNHDLNNITITDTAWNLGIQKIHPDIYNACKKHSKQSFEKYSRYYSLGVDAFLLAKKLADLDQDTKQTLSGTSGELFLDIDRYIIRKPFLAKLKKGIPTPLE